MKQKLLYMLTVLSLSALPNLSFGQTAPTLGSLTNFAVFTAAGAVTTNGASVVRGDLGTDAGAIAINAPGVVVGNIRDENSTEAATANAEVQLAYTQLQANTCTGTILQSQSTTTLGPGVYCQAVAGTSTLCGTLTLNGSSTDIFIFKFIGALETCPDFQIVLTGGALASNVYFQVGGAVALGDGTDFQGTIIADGAITLNTSTLIGRALSVAGAITLNASTVITPAQFALPVSLVSFTAKSQENRTVDITWTTSLETNNKGFIVERSKDLIQFEKVAEMREVAPNSKALKNYHLVDQSPFQGTSYYRLTQTDLSGVSTVYPAVSVVLRDEAYGVYPNPVDNSQQFVLRLDEPETATINFYNIDGRAMPLQKTGTESGNLNLKTYGKLSTGVYIITVEERGQTRKHRLVIE